MGKKKPPGDTTTFKKRKRLTNEEMNRRFLIEGLAGLGSNTLLSRSASTPASHSTGTTLVLSGRGPASSI